jgi:mannose-6-phosphate isomerase-like protein (cupin superfamily)
MAPSWSEATPRLIVAAHDELGKPVFARVEDAERGERPAWRLWGSDGTPRIGEADPAGGRTGFPPLGGVRMCVSEMPPGKNPAGVHASDTIDFIFVLSGSVFLIEGEAELELFPGDCVVQTGTAHAWENRGTEPARMGIVLLGVPREEG